MTNNKYIDFFEEMEARYRTLCAARIVSSFEEAYEMQYTNKRSMALMPENVRYNRFQLVYMEINKYRLNTMFDFSMYLDLNKNLAYLFLDDITTKPLRLENKEFPKIYAQINLNNFYKEVDAFLDNEFLPKIFDYYLDSEYDFKDLEEDTDYFFATLCEDGDLQCYGYFNDIENIEQKRMNFLPYNINPTLPAEKFANSIVNLIDISIISSKNNNYTFINDGNYIWGMKTILYNSPNNVYTKHEVLELEA